MNETFSKILQITIIFWILLGGLAIFFGDRIGVYFINDQGLEGLKEANSWSGITILWDVATFQVTETVPLFVSVILDTLAILTTIAVIMAITNR